MKNLLFSAIIGSIALGSFSGCKESGESKISVSDSDDEYEFFAKYDVKKTRDVQNFINSQIAPRRFAVGEDVDVTATLGDKTKFELKESKGKVRIRLDKGKNSVASYKRIKQICEGIKREIGKS